MTWLDGPADANVLAWAGVEDREPSRLPSSRPRLSRFHQAVARKTPSSLVINIRELTLDMIVVLLATSAAPHSNDVWSSSISSWSAAQRHHLIIQLSGCAASASRLYYLAVKL